MRISTHAVVLISALFGGAIADDFNYGYTSGDNYGPAEWNKVECNDLDSCVSTIIIVINKTATLTKPWMSTQYLQANWYDELLGYISQDMYI